MIHYRQHFPAPLRPVLQPAVISITHYVGQITTNRAVTALSLSQQVAYNFTLPYESKVQKDGLTYPVVVWRDFDKGLSRMDTFGGRNILITTKVQPGML